MGSSGRRACSLSGAGGVEICVRAPRISGREGAIDVLSSGRHTRWLVVRLSSIARGRAGVRTISKHGGAKATAHWLLSV